MLFNIIGSQCLRAGKSPAIHQFRHLSSQTRLTTYNNIVLAGNRHEYIQRRYASDAKVQGMVIGIDLGTTNSCVAVM
ncbi:unnamed protein product, partial [Medioppia subpectinata]